MLRYFLTVVLLCSTMLTSDAAPSANLAAHTSRRDPRTPEENRILPDDFAHGYGTMPNSAAATAPGSRLPGAQDSRRATYQSTLTADESAQIGAGGSMKYVSRARLSPLLALTYC